jgi:hypothetical protein
MLAKLIVESVLKNWLIKQVVCFPLSRNYFKIFTDVQSINKSHIVFINNKQ